MGSSSSLMTAKPMQAHVARQVRRQIVARGLGVGERLPSSRELGSRLGVSQATVHRALKQLENEGVVTCKARSGWYVTSRPARQMAASHQGKAEDLRGRCIAVSFSGLASIHDVMASDRWTHRILAGCHRTLAEAHVNLLMLADAAAADPDPDVVLAQLDDLGAAAAGVLIVDPRAVASLEPELARRQIPWVTINRPHSRFLHNFVGADLRAAGRSVGFAFGKLGYRRVLMLGADFARLPSTREMFEGLCSGYLEACGRPIPDLHHVPVADSEEIHGYEAMDAFLRNHRPPQGVFCSGDYIGVGAMHACQQHGLRIPEDAGVVGTSGLPVGQDARPGLTTFVQPMDAIGATAAELLLHMIRQGLQRVPGRLLPGEMLYRASLPVDDPMQACIRSQFTLPD